MAGKGSEYIIQAWAVANHNVVLSNAPVQFGGGIYKEKYHD